MRSTIERVASLGALDVRATFFRHAAPNRDAFAGGRMGRWGAAFPVIYLGKPEAGVVIEAYRHLVEDAGVPRKHVRPRILYTVPVAVTKILDLTEPSARRHLELEDADLTSEVGDYDECQRVAAAAHQLRLHGILAPAAHGYGTTLALFRERLPVEEIPVPSAQSVWEQLPEDPRRLRLVQRDESLGS